MVSLFCVFLLLTAVVFGSGGSMNNTLREPRLGLPVVQLSYPDKFRRPGSRKIAREVIQKEDPTDVEEFPVNEGHVFDGDERKGVFPNYDYPGGFNPYNPVNPIDPTSGVNPLFPSAGGELDAFTARRAVDFELYQGSKIKFIDTVTRLGYGWNNNTSEFFCRSPGVFFFTFSVCGEQFRHFRVTLKLNGVGIVSAFGDLNGYQMATNSVVLRLLQGDVVYLTLDEGGIYEVSTYTGRAYNTFSGFRIL